MDRQLKKVLRSPMPKKRSKVVPLSERVTLERVLGVTVKDDSALACDPNSGLIAYPAGCVIVIFNPRNNKQTHIFNQSKKTITALAFSPDGKNLVSGECGHNPAVRVWDVEDRSQVAELQGHKFGVACVAFSPNLRYVVSIGEQHDMAVNVWNWKEGAKVCSGKISNKVTGLCFSEDGGMFVTVGNRNVKFWYLSAKSKTRETIPLNGRSGILGEQRNNFFCSVACGKGRNSSKTYCITKSGLLCEFNDSRLLDKWVELRTLSAFCLSASEDHLYVGCADGVLRVFDSSTLHFVATFPKPHFLGVNVSDGIDSSHMVAHQDNAKYPDTIALVLDNVNKKVTCIYNDHSVYVWDVHDVKKIGKQWSFLYHSSCIWGVEVYPKLDGLREMLPPDSFITCSSDDTMRIWNTDPAMTSDVFKRNIYSKELLKILYIDEEYENLLDVDYNPAGTSDKTDPGEGNNGVRCLCVSPDGQYLASGDRSGNIRVHDLQFMDELHCIEAHDSEVLCLEFTIPETGYNLLASASRDRLIHVFNMDEQCSLMQTIDDHSSCITAVKFSYNNAQLQMISCGADKALMFRTAVQNPDLQFLRNHHVVGKQTLYDIAIDPTKKFVATACQDRNLRIHNTVTGKLKRIYKGSQSDDGTLIRVELDPSGMYVATSCSDKTLAIYDFYSGECVGTMTGHSELVTGIKFSNDCKHLISVSGDGCIFLWQLPWGITHNMKERLAEIGQVKRRREREYDIIRRGTYVVPPEMPLRIRTQIQAANQGTRNNNNNTDAQQAGIDEADFISATEHLQAQLDKQRESTVPEDYRFSMGQLPLWAKKQVSGEDIPSPTTYSSPSQPKGRWAQRIDSQGIKVKSEWENTIEVRLEDCLDRRRYTVEPDALLDQVRILSHLPVSIQYSIKGSMLPAVYHIYSMSTLPSDFPVSEEDFQDSEDAEFMSAEEGLKTFERELTEEEMSRLAQSFVTSTRGSDPFLPPSSRSGPEVVSPLAHEDDQEPSQDEDEDYVDGDEETSSAKEEDSKEEDIIYPPSDETPSSPENLKFEVTESTQSCEELARRKSMRKKSKDVLVVEKKTDEESSQLTSPESEATDPTSISTDDDEDGIEEDSLEDEEGEEEEEESSPTTSESKSDAPMSSTSPNHDEEEFLHTNFNFMEKEKFGMCLEQLQSEFTDDVATGRLSISSKFLSRAQMSQGKGPVIGVHGLAATSGGISAEQYLLRRKQEMAMAVDKTRRRLQMLGWKVSDSGKKLVSASGVDGSSKSSQQKKQRTYSSSESKVTVSDKVSPASSSSTKDSGAKELDRADSLEDILDSPSETSEQKAVVTNAPSKDSSSPRASRARKPPVVPPKPRRRKKSNSKSSDGDTQGTSSSGEDLSRSDDSLISKDETPSLEGLNNKPRKKELPQIPVVNKGPATPVKRVSPMKATGQELSPEKLEKMKLQQEDDSADKENSRYSSTEVRRASCGAAKAKINKMKNKKEREVVMRRAASMTDIGTASSSEKSSSPTAHTMTLRSQRSQSSERPAVMRSVPNSPAREKHRVRNDRMVPLLPNQQQKLKSYEIGTQSSRAKVNPRADTPPSSPHRYNKKKRSLLTELKDNKSKADGAIKVTVDNKETKNVENKKSVSPVVDIVRSNSVDKEDNVKVEAQITDIKSDPSSQASLDSLETDDDKLKKTFTLVKEDDDKLKKTYTLVKEDADRIAMPPPASLPIGRSKNGRKTAAAEDSRVNDKRKDMSSDGNGAQIKEQIKDTQIDEKPLDAEDEQHTISPILESPMDAVAPNGHDVALNGHDGGAINGHDSAINGHDSAINGHDSDIGSPDDSNSDSKSASSPDDSKSDSVFDSKSDDVAHVNVHDDEGERTLSGGSDRSFSSTCDSIPDEIFTDDATEPVESASIPSVTIAEDVKGKMSLDLSSPTKGPSSSSDIVTPEELRTGVDEMKQAFDSCLSLFTKATSPDTPDISKGHHMLDYLSSTLNSMQNQVTRLQSERRRFYTCASQESLLSASSASLTSLQDHTRDRTASAGCLPGLRKSSSSLSHSDLSNLKMNLAKMKSPGNGKSREDDTEAASTLVLLDHYSEMLVSMVRDKIVEDVSEGMLGRSKEPPFASDV
ncbi:uncharacterized protein [Amphiura filiformis]|uniref:uncharacterized protein n=1 Tax=Amphiura filiformis TaxID=82378 RepID=UPI003B20D027